jgi:hypothetical protein
MFSLICGLLLKTNATMLLDMVHTIGETTHGRDRERKGNPKLNVVDMLTV